MTTLLSTQLVTIDIGGKRICENLSLAVNTGEIWGLLGANGSGKTTLLHALARLHTIRRGEIRLEGMPIQQFSPVDLAQRLGILFQEGSAVFPQTVWEYCLGARYPHLGYLKRESLRDREIAKEALRSMELDGYIKKNIQHLSGGEWRRVQIAALLTQTPKIYLLDEPTNHLDLRHQIQVLKTLQSIVRIQPATAILTLHDIHLVQHYCTHLLLLLPDGTLLHGTTQQMLTETHLSLLYQCQIKQVRLGDLIFWNSRVD